jgi:hypothetical protein
MDDSQLQAVREAVFDRPERDLYMHVGYFLTWYGHAELAITTIMALIMRERDLEAFHTVTKGLDAKTKALRFRQLCAVKKRKIGPHLLNQLKFFQKTICTFRDRISHTALVENGDKQFCFAAFDRLPWKEFGLDYPKATQPAETINRIRVFTYGLWLAHFAQALQGVMSQMLSNAPILETDHLQTNQLLEYLSNSPAPDPQTTPDRPAQTFPETQE